MKLLPLTQGKHAIVDDSVFYRVSRWKWTACFKPRKHSEGVWYAYRRNYDDLKRPVTEYLHHHVLPKRKGWDVDHKDRNGLDCRRRNLRYLSRSLNNANRQKGAGLSSRFKGVTWNKALGAWKAQIQFAGEHYNLGIFSTEERAARAYNSAARHYFGKAARINAI